MQLDNQIAVISGGGSGIGKACARWLSQRKVRVVVWDKSIEGVDKETAETAIQCDVSDEASVESAIIETLEAVGSPRILINCAGIAPAKRMVGKEGPMPLAAFKQVIDINLVGTFNVMRVVAATMVNLDIDKASGERGVIINLASVAAYEGQIGQLAYSASKGGVVSMTLPAARELAANAIRVNTIAPGLIATPLLLNMPQDVQDALAATVTFPKRLGRPEEVAQLIQQVIENELINGEVIRLDGALRMQAR